MSEPNNESVLPKRLFFALWPPLVLQQALHTLARERLGAGNGRLIPAEKLHLTLAFLGSVEAARRACCEEAAAGARAPAFALTLDTAGFWRRSGIVWIGSVQVPEPLLALVRGLNAGLMGCGYAPETRPFKVHITVARNARVHAAAAPIAPLSWSIDSFSLVGSQTLPDGARYQMLRTWPLG